jgi:hypothetical protein
MANAPGSQGKSLRQRPEGHASAPVPPRRRPFQRPRKGAGSLQDLRRALWYAICRLDYVIHDEELPEAELLRATHALSQIGGTYQKLLQASDFEQRLTKVEEALQHLQSRNGHGDT